ncbi:MAG: RQC domain-containing protein, partial [Planctomycetota bacterium]
ETGSQVAIRMQSRTEVDPALRAVIEQVVDSIKRIHGRLGKLLISQYLCGSQNAKVQKLNLHRLSGFGFLKGLRQSDVVTILDSLLAAGLLRQKEVNRNRPTVEVAPEWMDQNQRPKLIAMVQLPSSLNIRVKALGKKFLSGATAEAAGFGSIESGNAGTTASVEAKPSAEPANLDRRRFDASSEVGAERRGQSSPGDQRPDWQWTLWLFSQNKSWEEVLEIRQMTDDELAASFFSAIRAGGKVSRSWIKGAENGALSKGQQRVVRELQRRATAGIQ